MSFKFRKILKRPAIQSFLSWLVYIYLWFVYKSSTFSFIGEDHFIQYAHDNKPVIVTFFHGRLAMMPFTWRLNRPFYMLLSDHSDGHFIANVIKHHNIQSIYGSTTRGGMKATLDLVKKLKAGAFIGITPDGPKGPHQSVAAGVLQIAKLADAFIIPCTYAIKRHKLLKTWDKFMLPLPFSKGVFIIDTPFRLDEKMLSLPMEEQQAFLQQKMIYLENQADAWHAQG